MANRLDVTVMSRTAGFVTQVPKRIVLVFAAIRASSGYGSFHKTCESKYPAVVKSRNLRLSREADDPFDGDVRFERNAELHAISLLPRHNNRQAKRGSLA